MPEIDTALIQLVAIGLGAVVLLILVLTLLRRRRRARTGVEDGAVGDDLPGDEDSSSEIEDDAREESSSEDGVPAEAEDEDEESSPEPVAVHNGGPGENSEALDDEEESGGDPEPERHLSQEPVFARPGGLDRQEFETPGAGAGERASAVWDEAQERRETGPHDGAASDEPGAEDAGGATAEPAAAGAGGSYASHATVAPGDDAGVEASDFAVDHVAEEGPGKDPESEPFERNGRWWFRRDGELLVFEESSGQWAPVGAHGSPTLAGTPAAGAETSASSVTTEAPPEGREMKWPQRTFWKCGTCGAVNGATASSCRMCFAPSP